MTKQYNTKEYRERRLVSVYLEPMVKEALAEIAEEKGRSISGEAKRVIEAYVERCKKKQ